MKTRVVLASLLAFALLLPSRGHGQVIRVWAGAPVPLGNGSSSLAYATFILDQTNDAWEAIVQVPEAATITQVGFRYHLRAGTPPTYRISIQGVMATGFPDGTIKGGGSPASATFTPPADTTWDGTWRWITLSNSYTAARGEFIAIVIDYSSGTITAGNSSTITVGVDAIAGARQAFPYIVQNNAATQTKNNTTIPIVGWQTGTVTYGNPIETITDTQFSSGSSPNEYALKFNLAGSNLTYSVMGARCVIRTPSATQTYSMHLREGTTALQTVALDSDYMTVADSGYRLYEMYFDETTLSTLNAGTSYYLSFEATSAATSFTLHSLVADSAQDAEAWGGDGNWSLATRAGGAWTDVLTTRPWCELLLTDIAAGAGGGLKKRVIGS